MKKTLLTIGILAIMISMPAITAFGSFEKTPITKPAEDYDGTFYGGLGRVYKDENGEWTQNTYAYIVGAYKGGNYKRVYAKIYNLDEEEIGSIAFISGHRILIGRIKGMDEGKLPIIGFLFYNEQYFIGRIMSLVGPAPHIYGEYTPV
jgi:hypothetical protein